MSILERTSSTDTCWPWTAEMICTHGADFGNQLAASKRVKNPIVGKRMLTAKWK